MEEDRPDQGAEGDEDDALVGGDQHEGDDCAEGVDAEGVEEEVAEVFLDGESVLCT